MFDDRPDALDSAERSERPKLSISSAMFDLQLGLIDQLAGRTTTRQLGLVLGPDQDVGVVVARGGDPPLSSGVTPGVALASGRPPHRQQIRQACRFPYQGWEAKTGNDPNGDTENPASNRCASGTARGAGR
jgi:hypothetical protein